jgi:hypothetical protein
MDFQAIRERCCGGCKRKVCFLVAMNFARPWITGTLQWRKSHQTLGPERKGNRRPLLLPKS